MGWLATVLDEECVAGQSCNDPRGRALGRPAAKQDLPDALHLRMRQQIAVGRAALAQKIKVDEHLERFPILRLLKLAYINDGHSAPFAATSSVHVTAARRRWAP